MFEANATFRVQTELNSTVKTDEVVPELKVTGGGFQRHLHNQSGKDVESQLRPFEGFLGFIWKSKWIHLSSRGKELCNQYNWRKWGPLLPSRGCSGPVRWDFTWEPEGCWSKTRLACCIWSSCWSHKDEHFAHFWICRLQTRRMMLVLVYCCSLQMTTREQDGGILWSQMSFTTTTADRVCAAESTQLIQSSSAKRVSVPPSLH